MSLAMYAAPFDHSHQNFQSTPTNDSSSGDTDIIEKKKQSHNKTVKKYPRTQTKEGFDTNKVNSVLQMIHNNTKSNDEEEGDSLADFNPPAPPISAGVQRTIMDQTNQDRQLQILGKNPQPFQNEESLDLNQYMSNYGNQQTAEEYYKKYIPHFHPSQLKTSMMYGNGTTSSGASSGMDMASSYRSSDSQDPLLQKLNYMIHLLEEKQDERTHHVTEEVILYSFLGIFIIFIVDSFARAGKYVR